MIHKATLLMAAAGVLTVVPMAGAQPQGAPPVKPMAMAEVAPKAAFADQDMTAVAAAVTGSWKTTIQGANGAPASEVVMSAAPVAIHDVPNAIYVELCRGEALNHPYRQAIWQLHRVGGKLRMKTLEFRRPRGQMESAVGTWAAPDAFPQAIGLDDLVTTLDVELIKSGNQWKGKTPHSYPTSVGGAVEMTSELTIGEDFTTADKGMDASGNVVWGSDKGYTFKKFDPGVKAQHRDGGLIVIDYPSLTKGDAPKVGDKVMVQYSMYLEDGRLIDSSFERGEPWPYQMGRAYGRSVEGWRMSLADAHKGSTRRLIIPGTLGIPGGDVAMKVPANATLYVDAQILDVLAGGAPAASANGGPMLQPVKPGDPGSPDFKKMEAEMKQRMAEKEAKKKAAEEAAKQPPPK